jgi:hypothetical protein
MLKTIGIIAILSLPAIIHASEYEVAIADTATGEVQIEKCANEIELSNVTNFLVKLKTNDVEFSVKKLSITTTDAIKRGGGEGSGD